MVAPSEHTVHHRRSFLDGMKHIAKNKTYMLYCFAMIFFWFMFAQLTVSIPLHMYHLTQSERFVTFALTMNAITGFFCMILFRRLFIQINTFKLLKIGIILMALSLLMVSIYSSPYWLLACIVLFTLGETFVLPASDIAISEFSQEAFQGSYFGFFEISFAIGATLGNYAGSYLTNHDSNHTTLWITFFCVGMISFIFIGLLSRNAR
jgi:MFS family permease